MGRARLGGWQGLAVLAAVGLAACAKPQVREAPKPEPTANVRGLRVVIAPAPAVTTNNEECRTGATDLMEGLPSRLQKAAEKVLAARGFQVLSDPSAEHDLEARIDTVVSYCNPRSQIATGELGLTLEQTGRVISRAVATGDLVNPVEHLFDDLLAELVRSKALIEYADSRGRAP